MVTHLHKKCWHDFNEIQYKKLCWYESWAMFLSRFLRNCRNSYRTYWRMHEKATCRKGWSIIYNNFEYPLPALQDVKSQCRIGAKNAHSALETIGRRVFNWVFKPLHIQQRWSFESDSYWDETWVHHYEDESKQESMEWLKKESKISLKMFKSSQSAGKICNKSWKSHESWDADRTVMLRLYGLWLCKIIATLLDRLPPGDLDFYWCSALSPSMRGQRTNFASHTSNDVFTLYSWSAWETRCYPTHLAIFSNRFRAKV